MEIRADLKETERYLGYGKSQVVPAEIEAKIREAVAELQKIIVPQAVYAEFDLTIDGENISFSDIQIKSRYLAMNLKNCSKVILFASTK